MNDAQHPLLALPQVQTRPQKSGQPQGLPLRWVTWSARATNRVWGQFDAMEYRYHVSNPIRIHRPYKDRHDLGYRYGIPDRFPTIEMDECVVMPNRFPSVVMDTFVAMPNPYNPATVIGYQLPEAGRVRLSIYNLLGQEVRVLVDERMEAGSFTATWDGSDALGRRVASGVYLYRIQAEGFSASKRMLLLK